MKWFKETFLRSFETGKEIRISEKQFCIFEKYLPSNKEQGYIYKVYGTIDGMKIEAIDWACVGGHRYYVTIKA